jgi:hypothetical protein
VKKFYIASALVGTLLIAGVACWFLWPAPRFLSLSSPNKTYRVDFRGDRTRAWHPLIDHTVSFDLLKSEGKVVNNAFARFGDWFDPSFDDEYPEHAWVSEQVLKLGWDLGHEEDKPDRISVINRSGKPIAYLRIVANETFLVFELQPRSDLELLSKPQARRASLSWIACEGQFADGQPIPMDGVNFPLRNTPSGSMQYCISIENGAVKIASPQNEGYTDSSWDNPNIPKVQNCGEP